MLYSLSNITKTYGSKTILDIERLSIEQGHIYGLLGPNGAGKTTLLRILALLEPPTSGEVFFKKRSVVFQERHLQPLRREVVMINQHPILFTTTVYKNLEFGLKIRKMPSAERRTRIEQTFAMMGLGHLADAPAHKLSGGETQRVAIARAIVLNPKVLLCDEPTSNVDLENQAVILSLFRQINRQQKITIIYTTHDRLHAALAHKTFYMDHGRLTTKAYDNLFHVKMKKQVGPRRIVYKVADSFDLELETDHLDAQRILVDPRQITPAHIAENSTRPGMPVGKVSRIMAEHDAVHILVENGFTVTVWMSSEAYREKKLLVGDTVALTIPPYAIEFI